MPWGVTITPLPKFASTAPVFRSNLKTGSSGVLSAVDRTAAGRARAAALVGPDIAVHGIDVDCPPSCPTCGQPEADPSFGSRTGAGFASPSPVIGLPAVVRRAFDAAACASARLSMFLRRQQDRGAEAENGQLDS